MAATATQGHISGFYHAQIAFRNSNGYPMGNDPTPNTVSNGDTKHAYKLTGPVEATAPAPTREIATFRGGQKILGQRATGVSDFGTFEVTLSAYDETFNAYISGSTVDVTTASELAFSAPNSLNPDPPQLFLLLTAGIQRTDGTNEYITWIYPNVQIYPAQAGMTQAGGENPNALTYTVVPTTSTRSASGELFSGMSLSLEDDKETVYAVRYSSPISLTTYIQDTDATSFTLGYAPVSDAADGSVNVFTTNGSDAASDVSGVNTSTGAVTISAATAGDIWVALYPTNFAATS